MNIFFLFRQKEPKSIGEKKLRQLYEGCAFFNLFCYNTVLRLEESFHLFSKLKK